MQQELLADTEQELKMVIIIIINCDCWGDYYFFYALWLWACYQIFLCLSHSSVKRECDIFTSWLKEWQTGYKEKWSLKRVRDGTKRDENRIANHNVKIPGAPLSERLQTNAFWGTGSMAK
jgi:hypothetical protein